MKRALLGAAALGCAFLLFGPPQAPAQAPAMRMMPRPSMMPYSYSPTYMSSNMYSTSMYPSSMSYMYPPYMPSYRSRALDRIYSPMTSADDLNYVPGDVATIRVRVPDVRARVTVNGRPISNLGSVRDYVTSTMAPGESAAYTVRATWTHNERTVSDERTVIAQRGQVAVADFTKPAQQKGYEARTAPPAYR